MCFAGRNIAVKLDSNAGDEDFLSCNALLLTKTVRSWSSSAWDAAFASCVIGAVISSTRESVSATMFSWPDICRMLDVN